METNGYFLHRAFEYFTIFTQDSDYLIQRRGNQSILERSKQTSSKGGKYDGEEACWIHRAGPHGIKDGNDYIKAGFPLTVYDLRPEIRLEFGKLGARIATSSKDAATDADVLIIMLFNFAQTQEVLFGPQGAIDGLRTGAIVACKNTIAPSEILQVSTRLAENGIRTLDAPVSGGMKGAQEGTLTIFEHRTLLQRKWN